MGELVRTEHDHLELSATVGALRTVVQAIERGDQSAGDAFDVFARDVERLVELLVVHFDREEQGLFPFLTRELPEAVPKLERLESAHDAICGTLLRVAGIVRNGAPGFPDQWPAVLALFRRFDAVYAAHARDEAVFLRDLGAQLDERQRAALAGLLDGI